MGTPAELSEFTEFARTMEPRLRYALAGCLPPDRAREATQESLIYAWRHWEKLSAMKNPSGYLYRIAQRWGWKPGKPSAPLPEIGDEDRPAIEPGLVPALEHLSPMQRQVVYLVEGLGLSQHETAELLGVARTTIETHRARALAHLREELGVTVDD